ncbi:hypothetical protein SARC_12558 [Sphaeroforma arctica JP610]|uniref:Uncharacterized protein n=1 Tax=Sphaeroforma arctica JP610 TaxID=667725 RepID=A0A0L0FDQ8_9EUKA|nr:hypothetical protein SARC_12558 [Sphaeroforma arctica JP610]KNC74904.1 hypothetical protein SARC_12558 [Sphaeroforma arctica JP610]|eukprot:XP_014148806.1 hypothetical protein SARC_12558 [Sphaeroforma arctica JP610]
MQITSESGPTEPPCPQMGFQDQLYLNFTTAGETCGGTTCQSRGEAIAQVHWENTVSNIGSDCAKADQILTQSLAVAPATPKCINEAFVAKIQALYIKKFDSCVVECQGHGKEDGVRLGKQICSLADLFADDEGESLVITICSQEEQDACEFKLEGNALENCQSNYYNSKNDEYYQQLKAGCSISIGPDQPTNSPTPTPKLDPKCADKGKALGEDAWTQARRQVGDTCHDIDMAFADVSKAARTKPACQYEAYLDAVSDMYTQAQKSCINKCEGYGETRGQNTADQFCRVTALFSDDEGEEITVFVCNEEEKKACYAAFDARVEDTAECSERLDNADGKTKDFYDEVQDVCEISIGPDQ